MLTVLIATYNGGDTLPLTLAALSRLQPPPGGWKLVVIDNGSDDGSGEIVAGYIGRLPLTLVSEPRRGKNVALNAALDTIEGDLAVLTDDDVLPRPDWLVRLREVVDRLPEFSIFSGTILPAWEVEPPAWLLRAIPQDQAFAALVRAADGPCSLQVFGPNMAFRADIFRAGHRFDEGIGPDGTDAYPMGSETEMIRRLIAAGHRTWFCKEAVVGHIVKREQLDEAWLMGRAERYGRGRQAQGVADAVHARLALGGVPVDLLARIAASGLSALAAGLGGGRERHLRARWRHHYLLGVAKGFRSNRGGG